MVDSNGDGYDDTTGVAVLPSASPGASAAPSTASLGALASSLGVQLSGSAGGNARSASPDVFLGWGAQQSKNMNAMEGALGLMTHGFAFGTSTKKVAKTKSIDELEKEFSRLPAAKQRQWATWLTMAGYMGSGDLTKVKDDVAQASLLDVQKGYDALLTDANSRYQSNMNISPTALLKQAIGYRLGNAGLKWNGDLKNLTDKNGSVKFNLADLASNLSSAQIKAGTKKTITSTSKSLDIMDPNDAKEMTREMLQQQLGRDPSEGEYEDFLAMLQHAQRANPTTSKTSSTYTYDKDFGWQQTGSNTVTHEGISSGGLEQLAYEKAQQSPTWAEWQAMGTYAPALFQALGTSVPGV